MTPAIKPLEWKGPDENTAYGEQAGFIYTVMSPNRTPGWRVWVNVKSLSGMVGSVGGVIITMEAESREAAFAAAQADYERRVLSALAPLPPASDLEPRQEAVDGIWPPRLTLRDTKVHADEGQRIFTTATGYGYEKREYVRADLAHPSPQPSVPAVVVDEAMERAYRKGHIDGRTGGTIATVDDDWSAAKAALGKE